MTTSPISSRINVSLLIATAIFLVIVMPALNAFGIIENFTLNLWGKYLCYGILAISIDCFGATPDCYVSDKHFSSHWAAT